MALRLGIGDGTISWETASDLAKVSKVSYAGEGTAGDVAARDWGATDFEFLDAGNTQGFIATIGNEVLITFRGTESLGDWLGNLKIDRVERPYGRVHRGFSSALEEVLDRVSNAISSADSNEKRIWVTGHSLGGALATLAAAEFAESNSIAGIYTYGQPRLGDSEFEDFFQEKYSGRFFRFVNDTDLVTRIVPGFNHVGTLVHLEASGAIRHATPGTQAVVDEVEPLTRAEFEQMQREIGQIEQALQSKGIESDDQVFDASVEGLFPGLSDHKIDRYIAAIGRFLPEGSFDPTIKMELESRARIASEMATRSPSGLESSASGASSDQVPVLLRLKDTQWAAPSGVEVHSQFSTFVSGRATAQALQDLEMDPNVTSIEVSRDAGREELSTSVLFVGGNTVHHAPISEKGDSALVGIVDTGIDVLHETFRDAAGGSRILAIWNQRDSTGPTPKEIDSSRFTHNSGTLYVASDINDFISGTKPVPVALRDLGAHGTHVASIAAGRGVGSLGDGMAPEAQIAAVIPNMVTDPTDAPSIGYSSSHVEALDFLKRLSRGGNAILSDALPAVVNVSLGMNAGAHDGSSLLEAAFDSITGSGRDSGFVIVKSAGNERGHGGHARLRAFSGAQSFVWNSLNKSRMQDYFEVWYSSLDDLEFTLVDPAGNQSATVSRVNPSASDTLGGNLCQLRLTPHHPDNGDSRLVLRIVRQPNAIQTGKWKLNVVGTEIRSKTGQVDIWVERIRHRSVRFEGDEPEMTLSIPGTASTVITVSACNSANPLQLTASSSFGLTRDNRSKPDICAPGLEIIAAQAGDSDHQATVAMTGTSMAAPHVTGALALALSHRHKQVGRTQYNAQQLQSVLVRSAKNFSGLHHEGFGFGSLDVAQFFSQLP